MEGTRELKGTIFDIQGLSIHDGPGCRTAIFLKGCSLRCSWCSNPEGIEGYIEPLYYAHKCIYDGNCVTACTFDAIQIISKEQLIIDRSKCQNCHDQPCIEVCLTGALQRSAKSYTLEEVFKIIRRDRHFWGRGGGITLSGGEPLYQFEFTYQLLKKAHGSYIHTAIETCGQASWSQYEKVLPYLDWIFFDLKQMNPVLHKQETQHDNALILENARKIAEHFKGRLVFRTPIIPGYNDSDEHINQLAEFINQSGRKEINLLPLHLLGREKYRILGYSDIPISIKEVPTQERMEEIGEMFKNLGITAYIGSETDF